MATEPIVAVLDMEVRRPRGVAGPSILSDYWSLILE